MIWHKLKIFEKIWKFSGGEKFGMEKRFLKINGKKIEEKTQNICIEHKLFFSAVD
jgi:hypothetical protein